MASASLLLAPPMFMPKELARDASAPKLEPPELDSGTSVTLHL